MSAEDVFNDVRELITSYQGYGLESLSLSVVGVTDCLEIRLRWGPEKPDITLSIRSIYYFAIHRVPGDDIPFFDIQATPLAPNQPWPQDLPNTIATTEPPPPLLWIRGDGPASFDVVAAIVTVMREAKTQ